MANAGAFNDVASAARFQYGAYLPTDPMASVLYAFALAFLITVGGGLLAWAVYAIWARWNGWRGWQ